MGIMFGQKNHIRQSTPNAKTSKNVFLTCFPKNGSSRSGIVLFIAFKSWKNKRKSHKNM